jgi:hypothetical protein
MFCAGGVGGGMGDILLHNNRYPYTRKGGPGGFRQKNIQKIDSIDLERGPRVPREKIPNIDSMIR